MIVDDSECLRTWLTAVLRPLCDADPAALAKYVLALIKKDKTDEELKQGMIDQLDVFLQNETKGFVEILFKVLITKEYMPPTESIASEESVVSISSASTSASMISSISRTSSGTDSSRMDTTSSSGVSTGPHDSSSSSGCPQHSSNDESSILNVGSEDRSSVLFRRDIKKEDDKERERIRRNKSRSPRRSNSKSRERGRRSRSPRDYRGRHRGRKSPIRRYDRQERDIWDRRRSPPARNRSASPRTRSRTPPRYRRPYNSRSNSRSRSPVMVRSPLRETKDPVQTTAPARFIDLRMQETADVKPVISTVMRPPPVPSKVPEGYTTVTPISTAGNRCRDFDERGLCMRGELCPFDHGCNPVVLEDVGGQTALKQQTPGEGVALVNERPEYRITDPIMYPTGMIRPPRPAPGPENEGMEPPHGWSVGPPYRPRHNARGRGVIRHGYLGPQRELISVPVVGSSQPGMAVDEFQPIPIQPAIGHRGLHMRGMHMGRGRGGGRGSFDHGRLGSKAYRNNTNCSLEVKRIPREQNNIMDLNSHFWRFGKIVNIQINFEGDPEAALITFSSPVEAFAAYRSTEAVLNNRFVKVFWHNKEKENEDGETFQSSLSVRDRLGTGETHEEPMEQEKILVSGNSLTKTVYNPNALKKELAQEKVEAVEAIKRSQEMLAARESLKREQAEKKKEAMVMRNNLQKRKQDVLSEQIEQQKKLIQKVETGKGIMKPEEIDQLMGIVKSLQESIESIKTDLDKSSSTLHPVQKTQNQSPVPISKNKDETQKEILDAELDLYNKELEGGDTLALKRKVLELRSQAQAAGLLRGRGGYRGLLRSFTNRGRGTMRSLRRVDRRPTKICITGYPLTKSSEMLAHFAQYGLIENYETDTSTPSLTIKYENRKSAEVAMSQGRIVQHIPLNIQWVANAVVDSTDQQSSQISTNGEISRQDDLDNGGSQEEDEELGDMYVDQLDLYDQFEEEDEDEDERTWRR